MDHLLEFSQKPVLQDAGTISTEKMKTIAHDRYEEFEKKRRTSEAQQADLEDIKALEEIEKKAKRNKDKKKGLKKDLGKVWD